MKFSIEKNPFVLALSELSHAVSSNSPQAALRGIKIDVLNDTLILTSSDADISMQKKLVADENNHLLIAKEGHLLIEAKYLLEIVRKLDSSHIYVEIVDGNYTQFKGDKAIFKINGMNVNQYPDIDFSDIDKQIEIDKKDFIDIIEQTTFACSKQDLRPVLPVLTGVNFKLVKNNLVCTATDSFRLARKLINIDSDFEFNVTIPAKSLIDAKNTILQNSDKKVILSVNSTKIQIKSENMIFQSRILDGDYPLTEQLIPTAFMTKLEISRQDLLRAIDRTSFLKTEDVKENRLQLIKNNCILTSSSQEIGESREDLVATYEGKDLDISFDGNFVMDALKGLHGEKVLIQFKGTMKAFILETKDDPTTIQLILPLLPHNS